MYKGPVTIVLAAAGVIAVAHAAIAAINSESAQIIAAPVDAPVTYAVEASLESAATKATQYEILARAPAIEAVSARSAPIEENSVRVPPSKVRASVASTTFPSSAHEIPEALPAVAAYFDRKNANTVLTGAAGSVFPGSAAEVGEPLPGVVAYFDRMEPQSLAANAAKERVTAYVESLSQILALAPAAPTAAAGPPVTTTFLAP
jgi:hypothetical protein